VLIARTNHTNLKSIKCCNLVRIISLSTLFRIEAALAEEIRSTTDNVIITGQEQSVGTTAADFDDVLIKDVEGINTGRDASALYLLMAKLPKVVSTPRIDMSCLNPLITSRSCNRLLLGIHSNDYGEVLATRKPLDSVMF
jgi:hypothetical protein